MGGCLSSSPRSPSRGGDGDSERSRSVSGSGGRAYRRRGNRNRRESVLAFSDSNSSSVTGGVLHATKNRPLRRDKIRWKSDIPLTEGQLKSKRDEFWDTAPAFEGKEEIWVALKAAAEATETQEDFELAQAILDGAGISLPHGSLVEAYDELGTRYAIPVYCLSYPINLISDNEVAGDDSPAEYSEPVDGPSGPTATSAGRDVKLKVRVSLTDLDVKLILKSSDTVAMAKRKLQETSAAVAEVEPARQRWYFGGKLLGDKTRIGNANIPQGYVVQCVVSQIKEEKENQKQNQKKKADKKT